MDFVADLSDRDRVLQPDISDAGRNGRDMRRVSRAQSCAHNNVRGEDFGGVLRSCRHRAGNGCVKRITQPGDEQHRCQKHDKRQELGKTHYRPR